MNTEAARGFVTLTELAITAALLTCPLSETETALSGHLAECDKCAGSSAGTTAQEMCQCWASVGEMLPQCERAQMLICGGPFGHNNGM